MIDLLAQGFAPNLDLRSKWLMGIVVGALGIMYLVAVVLRKQRPPGIDAAIVQVFERRVRAWWMMSAILVCSFLPNQRWLPVTLFGLISFWALREYVTMTPTRRGDHRALFWVFFVFTPAQYILVGLGVAYYPFYSIMIPVFASLLLPARIAITGDPKRFLERSAKIQVGLLICVYSLSFAPALIDLRLQKVPPQTSTTSDDAVSDERSDSTTSADDAPVASPEYETNEGLLFYFVLVVELCNVFQFVWGKLMGRHIIAPLINTNRTWEGAIGGITSATICGILLWFVTPFSLWGAACISMVTATMGFCGSMVMSAIKRDRGVSDYGTLVQGHAGVLDRIDAICFAAPVFYHLAPFFYSIG
ncbi:MAG TPA: phosphatidate cytidylyltransferase [Planctomycetaceae bacterium]|nr:phosphatidate cytidylyltransferase [Planctomycetaceae bacterium]